MKQFLIAGLTVLALMTAPAGAQSDTDTSDKASADQKATIVALELMNSSLGKTQQKITPRLKMMREYLKENDLVEAFAKSQTDAEAKPALLSYEDALSTTVAHVKENEVAAEAEFDDLSSEQADRDIKALRALTEPRFDEVQRARGTVHRIATFLKSQDKLPNYMAWAVDQQDAEKTQQAATDEKNREADEAAAKAEQERSDQIRQRLEQQQHDDHQAELNRKFELKEQAMQDETTVQAAKYSGGGSPYWYGGWGDPYHEVY